MIITAIDGLCMAVADSVPGVSGGTVAFILGFYDRFIGALHDLFGRERALRRAAIRYLAALLLGWVPGMCACVLLLSGLFEKNIYFMSSLFMGLTVASIPFIVMAEKEALRARPGNLPFLFIGAGVVVGASLLRTGAGALGSISFLTPQPLTFLYLLLSGMVAITAMVLPGISGSTVLLIAGVYLPTVEAVKQLLHLDFAVLPGLMALAAGVVLGIAASVHFIRDALRHHRSAAVYLILGLMLGSLFAIAMGPATLSRPLPALGVTSFSLPGFALGIAVLLGLELLKKGASAQKRRKKPGGKKDCAAGMAVR